MGYSQWQIRVIRDALAAYRLYEPGKGGAQMTWVELAADIEVYTGVPVVAESLRQFVMPVSRRQNPQRHRVPQPEKLEAIVSYLTDVEIGALEKADLDESVEPSYQAAMRLLRYLQQNIDSELIAPPTALDGRYTAQSRQSGKMVMTNLLVDAGAGDGLVQVDEECRIYTERTGEGSVKGSPESAGAQRMRKQSRGWAILSPEDTMFFFMKEEPYGGNHYYMTMGADPTFWTSNAIDRFIVLRHDYPIEIEKQDADRFEIADEVARHVRRNLMVFTRVG